jgi:hypothetical protein
MKKYTEAELLAIAREAAAREDAEEAKCMKKAAEIRATIDARIAAKRAASADAPKA